MNVSIIITARNEEHNIFRLLKSIEPISDKLHEVIVVDAGSWDKTASIAKLFRFVTVLNGAGTKRGGGRNIGITHATGDVIAFLDADTEIYESWYPSLLHSIKNHNIVAGYSPALEGEDLHRVSIRVDGIDITYPSCNVAYKKKVLDDVGLFNEDMVTAEDIELNYRCAKKGYKIYYNPDMRVIHYHRRYWKSFFKQAYYNGFGRYQLDKMHPELKGLHEHGISIRNFVRLGFGMLGYLRGVLFGDKIK